MLQQDGKYEDGLVVVLEIFDYLGGKLVSRWAIHVMHMHAAPGLVGLVCYLTPKLTSFQTH